MNNIAILILGWLVFFSIVGYIAFIVVKELINVIYTKARIYQRTKAFERLIKRNSAHVIGLAIEEILHDREKLSKADATVLDWDLYDWLRHYRDIESGYEQ